MAAGKHNYLDELPSLDPALHKNLLYLKNYTGDIADLALDFTVSADDYGGGTVTELVPGGKDIEVTAGNRIQYIHLMADYRYTLLILFSVSRSVSGSQMSCKGLLASAIFHM